MRWPFSTTKWTPYVPNQRVALFFGGERQGVGRRLASKSRTAIYDIKSIFHALASANIDSWVRLNWSGVTVMKPSARAVSSVSG